MRKVPFGFGTATIELVQGVGVVTRATISRISKSSKAPYRRSRMATFTRRGRCWTGFNVSSSSMWYSPRSLPTPSPKTRENLLTYWSADKTGTVGAPCAYTSPSEVWGRSNWSLSKCLMIFIPTQAFPLSIGLTLLLCSQEDIWNLHAKLSNELYQG